MSHLIELADRFVDGLNDAIRGFPKDIASERSKTLSDNPMGHRIDVCANDAEPDAIAFEHDGASAHERISDDTMKIMSAPIR